MKSVCYHFEENLAFLSLLLISVLNLILFKILCYLAIMSHQPSVNGTYYIQ